MIEQQKQQQQAPEQTQTLQQLQVLLRDTIKESKSLQNKNAKLEAKYVELFKQQKAIKKDHSLFVAFISKYFNGDTNSEGFKPIFQQQAAGQYEMSELQKIAEQKELSYRTRITDLEMTIQQIEKERKANLESSIKEKQSQVIKLYEGKLKELKDASNKEVNVYLKELQSLRRTNKQQSEDILQLKSTLQHKHNQFSKISKQKLKLEHHLNNIRKKEIAEELSPAKEKQNEKIMNERNEFLSMRQQVESLMIKRDQLKRELKEKDDLLASERKNSEILEEQIKRLKKNQAELDQKYQLVRQCSIEELQNLILAHHYSEDQSNSSSNKNACLKIQINEQKLPELKGEDSAQIQHEYLKNILVRYIKAETSGCFDQALMLLEIMGTILRLDHDSSQALESYKNKRRQWWYIKY